MRNVTKHIGKLEVVRRLPSSRNGNPRYQLRVDGWSCRTAVDSMLANNVTNLDGHNVIAHIGTHYGVPTLESIEKA